jgi:hypothetical protein
MKHAVKLKLNIFSLLAVILFSMYLVSVLVSRFIILKLLSGWKLNIKFASSKAL